MDYYFIAIILLFLLASVDLVVGVSNDAINFLNSAIGSKVASRRTIMIIASLGIFMGAVFSSGMMEVARKGIFNPEYFYFSEIMVIFLAVMLTDILLLDLFNTLGMPTSTTVSIVFELLGAAVMVSILKLIVSGDSLANLSNYINTAKALYIIMGILLSVVVAFATGAVVQYFSRILFSFHFEKRLKYVGGIWSGIAFTSLSYFLIAKGLKGVFNGVDAAELSGIMLSLKNFISWITTNVLSAVLYFFIFWSIVSQILILLKVNIFKVLVLFGTFALAMAFAGNDLVNFIGVPIAAFQSYKMWVISGVPATEFAMGALAGKVPTETYLLLGAGCIMVGTLWFSKKARSVAETELNLAKQEDTKERFSANIVSKNLVKKIVKSSGIFGKILPKKVLAKIESNFKKREGEPDADVTFDLVRATVNLSVASVLIAIATSYKLPLSTTYVSFMVAMGSSLSDRAWDRENAVYRISGVMHVIGGWFMTAFIAFSAAAIFALFIYYLEMWGVLMLTALAGFTLYSSGKKHKAKELKKQKIASKVNAIDELTITKVVNKTSDLIAENVRSVNKIYNDSIKSLFDENDKVIDEIKKEMEELKLDYEGVSSGLFKVIKKTKTDDPKAGRIYIKVYDKVDDVISSLELINNICNIHVDNSHKPLRTKQVKQLSKLKEMTTHYLVESEKVMLSNSFENIDDLNSKKDEILSFIDEQLNNQVLGIVNKKYGNKNSQTSLTILLETKDLVKALNELIQLYNSTVIS